MNLADDPSKDLSEETILADFDLISARSTRGSTSSRHYADQGSYRNRPARPDLAQAVGHTAWLGLVRAPASGRDGRGARVDPNRCAPSPQLLKAAFPRSSSIPARACSVGFRRVRDADIILMVLQLDLTCMRNTSGSSICSRSSEGLEERVRLVVNRRGRREQRSA